MLLLLVLVNNNSTVSTNPNIYIHLIFILFFYSSIKADLLTFYLPFMQNEV